MCTAGSHDKSAGRKGVISTLDQIKNSLNIEIGDNRIDDIAEKIGAIFGEEARQIGKAIDKLTKDVTIKIGGKTKDDKDSDRND
jgi:hypothetical protein